ncbi:hypothetical protein LINPERHAP1_LOCUS37777 [Linum perenne]
MRGAIIGLQLAWELGQRKVVLQVDSRGAIQLLQEDWEVSIRHACREGNDAVDFLAGIGHGYPLGA